MVIITSRQTKPRRENDAYCTPQDLANNIVKRLVPFEPLIHLPPVHPLKILEPSCGNGAFTKAIKSYYCNSIVTGIDLVTPITNNTCVDIFYQKNFLEFTTNDKYDLVIGNPPYKCAEEFVRHSFDLLGDYGQILFLLKLAFLESKKRYDFFRHSHTPAKVHVLVSRPSFDGTGKTNDYAFAVFHWVKGIPGKINTELDWFKWK